MLRHRSRIIPD